MTHIAKKVLNTLKPMPEHFDPHKFKPNGEPLYLNGVPRRPRAVKPEQRAAIYSLMLQHHEIEKQITTILDASGVAHTKAARWHKPHRIWKERGA